jgi:PAT family beta-lactamase induction signal transducer AmpG
MTIIDFCKKSAVGFFYGVSFPLTIVILDYWLKDCGVSNSVIGLFSFFHLPFILKIFFAPIVDDYDIPYLSKILGKRRSWVFLSQLALTASLIAIANADPQTNLPSLMIFASLVALADGCQNIALYPYQISDIPSNKLGYAAGIVSFGHRIGMISTKLTMLYAAHFYGWKTAYESAAFLVFICMIFALAMREPKADENIDELQWRGNGASIDTRNGCISLMGKLKIQLEKLMSRDNSVDIFTIIFLYKAPDFLMQKMSRAFCLEIGFSKLEIANIVQLFGTVSIILGGFMGGYLIKSLKTSRAMLYLSFAHMLVLFFYLTLCVAGPDSRVLCGVIFLEGITRGGITAAFLAFIYNICKNGSQYALVWAMHEIGGIFFLSISGVMVDAIGWIPFFITAPLASIPNLILLSRKMKREKIMDQISLYL